MRAETMCRVDKGVGQGKEKWYVPDGETGQSNHADFTVERGRHRPPEDYTQPTSRTTTRKPVPASRHVHFRRPMRGLKLNRYRG